MRHILRIRNGGAFFAVLCTVLLCTCIPVRQRMNPAYAGRGFEGRRLLAYPASVARVRTNNADGIRRAFPGHAAEPPEKTVHDAFYLHLQDYLREHARGIQVTGMGARRNALPDLYGTVNARTVTLEYDEKHIADFQVARNEFLESNGLRPDVVLYLNRAEFMSMLQQRSDPNMQGSEPYLTLLLDYVLWDHAGDAAVSYGEIEVNEPEDEALGRKSWDNLFDKAAKKILYKTPFR